VHSLEEKLTILVQKKTWQNQMNDGGHNNDLNEENSVKPN
jgi:hypothetical protein